MTTSDLPSCVEPYLDSFEQSFAAANYTPGTLKNYRSLVRRLGRLLDAEGIRPAALTPDVADRVARETPVGSKTTIRFHNLARRFAEHLIVIGVAQPVPFAEAQIVRAALLADFEAYLVKQRGLNTTQFQRTIG